MIYFVTNKPDEYRKSLEGSIKEYDDVRVIDAAYGIRMYFNVIGFSKLQSFDLETTGLDPFVNEIVLTGIGNKNNQFIFDYDVDLSIIYNHIKDNKIVICGANLKFDIKFIQAKYGILLTRVYDVIIAEQRLYMKYYQYNNLAEIISRYFKEYRNKDVRNEFIGINVKTFKIKYHHIKYLGDDLKDPLRIRERQRPTIVKFKMQFLIYGIEFPFISVLADSENEGIDFNAEKWKENIKSNEAVILATQIKLDEELRRLRTLVDKNFNGKGLPPSITLGGLKYNNPRKDRQASLLINKDNTTNSLDLFGEMATIKALTNKKVYKEDSKVYPDYNSPKEIVTIFAKLNQPVPCGGSYVIPRLNEKGNLTIPVNSFQISAVAFNKYLIDKPDSIMIPFINHWLEFSKYTTKVSNFGYNYLQKLNPVTGKIHTIYRQTSSVTGRMQSGGGKKEPEKFQSQNVPADNAYRSCFYAPKGYKFNTSDYEGAELIVMASHAQDFKLISLSKIDMHSYMATICWRNIFRKRSLGIAAKIRVATVEVRQALTIVYDDLVKKAKDFTVTKTEPPGYRKSFKGMTFGTIYGMFKVTAGATLNIPPEEGQIVINTIEKELPKTFEMVKAASRAAEIQGFVINNYRTNSRAWFPTLIKVIKGEIDVKENFGFINKEKSDARNIRIQGTQADFIKEASVVLATYYRKRKVDAKILLWVHDEIVDKVNDMLLISENPNIDPELLPHHFEKGKFYKDIAEAKHNIMVTVANKYLNNVTINADHQIAQHWIK